ncbi:MAG TPA: hypothetical protein VFB82_04395 [Blastocatellia bacterium]|nr:hypothetical protein [Blastocatellia bacterium]
MRSRKQNLAMLLVLTFVAVLALVAPYTYRQTMAAGAVQDTSRSDVATKSKGKKSSPAAPTGVGPSNDNCANAITINACPFTDTQDTTGASDEAGEPQSTCTLQANSIWYTLPPSAATRSITVDTCASSPLDTAVMVWQATGGACTFAGFVPVACNDDFCGNGLQSSLEFIAEAGQTYKIQVGGFDGDTGTITTNVACVEFNCDPIVINGTLGTGDPNFTGTQTHGTTVGRLNRNGISSTCAAPKTCLLFDSATGRAFDTYAIPNESGEDACVTVNLDEPDNATCNLQSNAYLGSFVSSNICTNYLADPGLSTGVPPTATNFSFVVPAGQTLVLVVMTTNPGETGCPYTLTVLGDLCEQFDFCVQDNVTPGRFIKINSTTGAYEFHECSKNIVFAGTGNPGIFFCKVTLSDGGGNPPNRAVSVALNPCTGFGNAQVRLPGALKAISISDSNIFNNTCECP